MNAIASKIRQNTVLGRKMITPEQLAKSNSESGHAKALMCWAALNINQYPELKWLAHIPNGGWRDAVTANNLKAEGVKAGLLDYFLAIKRGPYSGLWLELKRPGTKDKRVGVVSKDQEEWIDHLRSQGFVVVVCHGWEIARNIIIGYLGSWK